MNLLFPTFNWRLLPRMLGIACLGACIAGLYGMFHDQVTYSISPEYFTRLKFNQFRYADFGFPPRVFVAEIGFLATWWVGFFSGWFLARIAVPAWPARVAFRRSLQAFLLIVLFALLAAVVGYMIGVFYTGSHADWADVCDSLGVIHIPEFVQVAYIHNSSYLGGLIGLFAAIVFLLRVKKSGGKETA